MPENPWKNRKSHAVSGGIRKAQNKIFRELEFKWDQQNRWPERPRIPYGVAISCECGHSGIIEGDSEELLKRRFRCSNCGAVHGTTRYR